MKFICLFVVISVITGCISAENNKPDGAIQFIGADGVQQLVSEQTGEPIDWPFKDGVLTVNPQKKKNCAITALPFKDFKMHIEFNVCEQGDYWPTNGNSGIFLQQRYEIQILNSFERKNEYSMRDCGSLYNTKIPDALVCLPAGQWQSYDIDFRAARWQGKKKTENARVTVYHNGVLIHDDVEISKRTQQGKLETPEALPIKLQDHSNPVKFRNFWLLHL